MGTFFFQLQHQHIFLGYFSPPIMACIDCGKKWNSQNLGRFFTKAFGEWRKACLGDFSQKHLVSGKCPTRSGLILIWGRCYDHNFLRFLPIFGKKNCRFSQKPML
jgi:hypothetical protein